MREKHRSPHLLIWILALSRAGVFIFPLNLVEGSVMPFWLVFFWKKSPGVWQQLMIRSGKEDFHFHPWHLFLRYQSGGGSPLAVSGLVSLLILDFWTADAFKSHIPGPGVVAQWPCACLACARLWVKTLPLSTEEKDAHTCGLEGNTVFAPSSLTWC